MMYYMNIVWWYITIINITVIMMNNMSYCHGLFVVYPHATTTTIMMMMIRQQHYDYRTKSSSNIRYYNTNNVPSSTLVAVIMNQHRIRRSTNRSMLHKKDHHHLEQQQQQDNNYKEHDRIESNITTTIEATNQHNTNNNHNSKNAISFVINDPIRIITDVFSILIAFEIMGFMDSINVPSFWSNGGLLQPIPIIPSTLLIFIQRFSINCIIFLFVSTIHISKQQQQQQQITKSTLQTTNNDPSIRHTDNIISLIVIYTVCRVILGISYDMISSSLLWYDHPYDPYNTYDFHSNDISTFILHTVLPILRECYYVAITTFSGRFILQNIQQ